MALGTDQWYQLDLSTTNEHITPEHWNKPLSSHDLALQSTGSSLPNIIIQLEYNYLLATGINSIREPQMSTSNFDKVGVTK